MAGMSKFALACSFGRPIILRVMRSGQTVAKETLYTFSVALWAATSIAGGWRILTQPIDGR